MPSLKRIFILDRIEGQYGKPRRIWLMDRGVPTEKVLTEMRAADPPVHYLVGTPKGRLTRLEKQLIAKPWQEARPGVQVKLLPQEGELYVLAQSRDRVAKERAMFRYFACANGRPGTMPADKVRDGLRSRAPLRRCQRR